MKRLFLAAACAASLSAAPMSAQTVSELTLVIEEPSRAQPIKYAKLGARTGAMRRFGATYVVEFENGEMIIPIVGHMMSADGVVIRLRVLDPFDPGPDESDLTPPVMPPDPPSNPEEEQPL